MRVGITGHQYLEDPRDWEWVSGELHNVLQKLSKPLIGITCLAIGTDSLFARLLLEHDGSLEVVLPFPSYELKLPPTDRDNYQQLLRQAARVTTLQKRPTDEESYLEAGKRAVNLSDLLIAIWDSKPARGLGGTADIVKYAREKQKPIIHLDPVRHVINSSPPLDRLVEFDSDSPHPVDFEIDLSEGGNMKTKKRVDKTNRTKDQSQRGPARSKGGGRLDGRAIKTSSKRNTKGSERNRTPA